MTTTNQHTRYIEVNKGYATIRLDEVGADTLVTVYNVNVKDIDLLIEKLQAIKAEQEAKAWAANPMTWPKEKLFPELKQEDEPEEPPQMTAVLGPKPDEKKLARIIGNRTAQGFSPKAIAHQIKKQS